MGRQQMIEPEVGLELLLAWSHTYGSLGASVIF